MPTNLPNPNYLSKSKLGLGKLVGTNAIYMNLNIVPKMCTKFIKTFFAINRLTNF